MKFDQSDSQAPMEVKRARKYASWYVLAVGVLGLALLLVYTPFRGSDELLNVSYDATREFFHEADAALGEHGNSKIQIVYPSMSIKAEPVVAVMDRTAEKRGAKEIANAYLQHLFSKRGQETAARNFLRPRDPEIAGKNADRFPKIELITVEEVFGGWEKAQEKHFAKGGTFDRIYEFEHLKRHSF